MNALEREYLGGYFHDSVLGDWHYDQTSHTLTLALQCDWEAAKNGGDLADKRFTYRIVFEGIQSFRCDAEKQMTNFPLFWFDSGACTETEDGQILYHMRLNKGSAEIVCRDIRVECARGELLPPKRSEKGYYTYEI